MFAQKRILLYVVVGVIFLGVCVGGMTSCLLGIHKTQNENAGRLYEEIRSAYESNNLQQADEKLKELKKRYGGTEYERRARVDFKDLPDKLKHQQEAKATEDRQKNEEYQEKLTELIESYNKVLSSNNGKAMYEGCSIKGRTITIYVNDYWSLLSKDSKIGAVKSYMQLWGGMHGARKMKIDYNDWKLCVRHVSSERTLATWDSLWGPSIKD